MRSGVIIVLLLLCMTGASALDKVTLQLQWVPRFQFAGYYMAKEKGFYRESGLDVQIKPVSEGVNVEAEVISGRAQFGIGRSSLLIAYDQKQPLVALAAIFQSSPMVLLVRADSGIKTVQDLRRKRVMLTQDLQSAASIQAMLRSAGVQEDDIIVQPHSFDPYSLERNETDAMASYISCAPFVLKQHGIKTIAINPKHAGFDFYSDILFTSGQELKQHPGQVRRFYEASLKGWHYAFAHIDETARILHERYNPSGKSLEAFRFEGRELKKLALTNNIPLGQLNLDRLNAIAQAYRLLGYTSGNTDLKDFIYYPDRLILTEAEEAWLKAHPVLRVGVDPSWPPVESLTDEGIMEGISSGYIREISRKLGVRVEVEHLRSWSEVQSGLQTRKLDIASAMMDIPERREYATFSKPYMSLPMVIVAGASLKYVGSLASLNHKRVAVARGYAADLLLKRDYPQIKLIHTSNMQEALKKVAYGGADAAVDALSVVSYLIAKEGFSNLRIVGQTPYSYHLSMGIRSDWPLMAQLVQKALDAIDPETREAIYHHWVPTVYEHKVDYGLLWKVLAAVGVAALLFGYKYFRLDVLVRRRTRELEELNQTLNDRIERAVAEKREKEQMMVQQAKMATIGEMIESIAHQWRQPLNIMGIGMSNLDLKHQMGTLEPQELDSLICTVQRQVEYMSQTIDDFRNFFKKDKVIERVALKPLIEDVVALLKPAFHQKSIEATLHLPENIEADLYPNELKQVILNLLNNARDALLGHSREDRRISIRLSEAAGQVCIEVSDNAGGVPQKIIDKIFEPYFTTKFESQGTGIGLYMSKIIVEKNLKGSITVRNERGGAVFAIQVPARRQKERGA